MVAQVIAVGGSIPAEKFEKDAEPQNNVYNLRILSNFKGSQKGLLKRLSQFRGSNGDKRKTKYVMRNFKYIKSKSARDYLMELGLVRNAVALDVRIQNILQKIGIKIPKGARANESEPEYTRSTSDKGLFETSEGRS